MITMSRAMFERVSLRWKRWIIGLPGLALTMLVTGCSTLQLGYNQGPLLAYWWLARYTDFTPEQAPRVRSGLAEWFAWHRSTQLPVYADALAQLQRQASDDFSAAQLCEQWSQWQRLFGVAMAQALPAMGEIARLLTPEQLAQIERHQAKQLAEARKDYLQPVAADRLEAAFERTLDRAEQLYGRLDEPQRRVLREALARSPADPERSLAGRRARQQAFITQLRTWQADPLDRPAAEAGLRRLVVDSMASSDPATQAYQRRVTEANCALAAQLHNATTPAQRRKAVATLRNWEQDLRALVAR
jgi:Family of unknown function (DUF6279)